MTVIAWMLYTLLIGMVLALTARGFEEVCRIMGRPTRWVWIGAMVLTLILAGLAPRRTATLPQPKSVTQGVATGTMDPRLLEQLAKKSPTTPSAASVAPSALYTLQTTIAAAWQRVPPAVDRYIAIAWSSLTACTLLLMTWVYLRFRRLRRGWLVTDLQGVRVRVATKGGPAVVGLVQPEIVVPQWLLGRTPEEQRIVLTHEREHVRAGDPLLLAGACVTAALLPWHPAVWWMLSRIRLAIELDCDVRVLRQGVAPRAYGSLLIDMAERCSGFPLTAPALADRTSHLQQRLLAMKPLQLRLARVRGGIFGGLALLGLVVACAAQVPVVAAQAPADPTAEQVATLRSLLEARQQELTQMLATLQASAEQRQATAATIDSLEKRHWQLVAEIETLRNQNQQNQQVQQALNRIVATRAALEQQAKLSAHRDVQDIERALMLNEPAITAMGKQRPGDPGNSMTVIQADSVLLTAPIKHLTDILANRVPGLSVQHASGASGEPAELRLRSLDTAQRSATPIVIVDGVRVYAASGRYSANPSDTTASSGPPRSPLDGIDPTTIEAIEVLKGPSAAAAYGADATNGVIVIRTKKKKSD